MTTDAGATLRARLELEPKRSGGRRRLWLAVGLLLLVAAIGGVAAFAFRPTPPPYDTAPVRRGSLKITVDAVGQVQPRNDVILGSEVSGIVADVAVVTGDHVEAGQVVARLDASTVRAQRDAAKAQLSVAQAALRQADVVADEAERARVRAEAIAADVLSDQQLDQARSSALRATAARGAAAAQVEAAKASLASTEAVLSKTAIRAPISGVVLERHVEPGQAVVSALRAEPLFRIAEDLSRMVVRVSLDEADVGRVHPGQQATFTVAAHATRTFAAVVEKVEPAPKITGVVVTYEAVLATDNADGALLPGMTATADIVADSEADAILVPAAALRFEPDDAPLAEGARVWVLRDGTPTPVPVDRIASEGDVVSVRADGLAEGDLVVIGTRDET